MRAIHGFLAFSAFAAISASAMATESARPDSGKDDNKKWWGIDVGVFWPRESEIRHAFDDRFLRVGIRPFQDRLSPEWKFTTDITVISARNHGNRMFVAPVTFGFVRSFGAKGAQFVPWVQIAGGPAYYDYSINREVAPPPSRGTSGPPPTSQRFRTRRLGFNANLEIGVTLGGRLAIYDRYDWFTDSDDFSFNGWSKSLEWALFRW